MWFLLGLLMTPLAYGNGQSTHLWITDHALTHLPEGELKTLLTRPDLDTMLRNGTMFPDGGYAVNDNYGEIAHWESFQGPYLDWIRQNHPPPFSDMGAEHVAFLMGLASHGMADQVFDSLFMERSKLYDTWGEGLTGSLDAASDVLFVRETGPQLVPEPWFPEDLMIDLFQDAAGHEVDARTLNAGQLLLGTAIEWVGQASTDEAQVNAYLASYPWASEHLFNAEMPGSPPCEGEVIARYWEALWSRLHDADWGGDPVIAALPAEGDKTHDPHMDRLESRITVIFGKGLSNDDLSKDQFTVTGPKDTVIDVEPWLFYRNNSHVVHLVLNEDLAYNTKYTVTVRPGVIAADGEASTETVSYAFKTMKDPDSACAGCNASHNPIWAWSGFGGLCVLLSLRRRPYLGKVE